MDRPGWKQLEDDIRAGKVAKLVCWKLDRLGRTARARGADALLSVAGWLHNCVRKKVSGTF